jgi:hypothetical protein
MTLLRKTEETRVDVEIGKRPKVQREVQPGPQMQPGENPEE